jgi:Fe-S-cluster containining protein
MIGFVDEKLCTDCAGVCCKSMSGASFPEDWGVTPKEIEENLRNGILTRNWVVDWWEGDPRENTPEEEKLGIAYFVRPAHKNKENLLGLPNIPGRSRWPRDPSFGGECVFLEENGCVLQFEDRPKNCRMLEPKPKVMGETVCEHNDSHKPFAAIAWIPYQNLIREILQTI